MLQSASHQGQVPNRASAGGTSLHSTSSSYPYDRMLALIDTLREQQHQLMTALTHLATFQVLGHRHVSPLQSKIDEDVTTPTTSTPALWHSGGSSHIRTSFSSTWSNTDGSSVWFDAIEGDELGAEEFVVAEQDDQGEDDSVAGAAATGAETSNDMDRSEESEVEADISIDESPDEQCHSHQYVDRRTRLPAKPVGDEGSLFAVLKKNVGQVCMICSRQVTNTIQ